MRIRQAVLPAVMVALALGACNTKQKAQQKPLRPVRTQTIPRPAIAQRSIELGGAAEPAAQATMSFNLAGVVERVLVKTGDVVKKGQILARLNQGPWLLALEEARATAANAYARLEHARLQYLQARGFYETGAAPREELDAARASVRAGEASMVAARTRVRLQHDRLAATVLRAPVPGTVSQVLLRAGDHADAGQPVVALVSTNIYEVHVSAPEDLRGAVKVGQKATVTFEALSRQQFAARVADIGAPLSPESETFPLLVRLSQPTTAVQPGNEATVTLMFPAGVNIPIVVPSEAVGQDSQGTYVYVVRQQAEDVGVVERRGVVAGQVTSAGVRINKGLKPGDRVVTAGVSEVQAGQKVRLGVSRQ